MGLYPQPNSWTCGPFALKHALAIIGVFVDEREVARLARTHWWNGTDEIKLARAARAYGCDLPLVRRKNADRARRELVEQLRNGHPTLLCVDKWSHWVTAVHVEGKKFVVLDSSHTPVVQILSWRELSRSWDHTVKDAEDPDNIEHLYDLHPLVPTSFNPQARATLSLTRARHLRRRRNGTLLEHWDTYFSELMRIGRPSSRKRTLSMGELLRRHGAMLLEEIVRHDRRVKPAKLRRVLAELQFVAETYGVVIPPEREKRAIAALTSYLTAAAFGSNRR
jgi:hypothetical protein